MPFYFRNQRARREPLLLGYPDTDNDLTRLFQQPVKSWRNVLEQFAISFINLGQEVQSGLIVFFVLVGALVAGFSSNSQNRMKRGAYFLNNSFIVLGLTLSGIIWLASTPALIGGYLWIIVLASVVMSMVAGYFFGLIAMARSRDAYGSNGYAILAFIPIANLWLLFTGSKAVDTAVEQKAGFSGGVASVLVGLFLLALSGAASEMIEQSALDYAADPQNEASSIEAMVHTMGLGGTLQLVAREVRPPLYVDEITTLARIEAYDRELSRTYLISDENISLSENFRARITASICGYQAFLPLLEAGAIIRDQYLTTSGRDLGMVSTSMSDCR